MGKSYETKYIKKNKTLDLRDILEKNKQKGIHQIKSFCLAKETIIKIKRN